jgi:DNA polymerase-3 subunit delta'
MLKDHQHGQPIAYNILANAIKNKAIAHAYLFYADSSKIAVPFAISFAKTLLCPKNKLSEEECLDCTICHRINNNNFPEFKIIEPDGLWIKKDQLIELQEEFKMKALEGDKKIYVINEVDKLNNQAANSILKFLEEPESNIIALLTTSDIHSVLETIVSRCQVIFLKGNLINTLSKGLDVNNFANKTLLKIGMINYSNNDDILNYINDAKNVEKLENIVSFIKKYEALKLDVMIETKKLWNDKFTEKTDYLWAFEVMIMFYKDVLNFILNRELEIFDYYIEIIEFVASINKKDDIIYKLKKILLLKEKIKYNINSNLLIDKLIIELESGEHV